MAHFTFDVAILVNKMTFDTHRLFHQKSQCCLKWGILSLENFVVMVDFLYQFSLQLGHLVVDVLLVGLVLLIFWHTDDVLFASVFLSQIQKSTEVDDHMSLLHDLGLVFIQENIVQGISHYWNQQIHEDDENNEGHQNEENPIEDEVLLGIFVIVRFAEITKTGEVEWHKGTTNSLTSIHILKGLLLILWLTSTQCPEEASKTTDANQEHNGENWNIWDHLVDEGDEMSCSCENSHHVKLPYP